MNIGHSTRDCRDDRRMRRRNRGRRWRRDDLDGRDVDGRGRGLGDELIRSSASCCSWPGHCGSSIPTARRSGRARRPMASRFTDPIQIRDDAVFGHRLWAGAFDGVYFHYAILGQRSPAAMLFYRRGIPQRDGTIEWSADEQIAFPVPANLNAMYPEGDRRSRVRHPWVSVHAVSRVVTMVAPQDALVVRSDATDGSWTTSEGIPVHGYLAGSVLQTYPGSGRRRARERWDVLDRRS